MNVSEMASSGLGLIIGIAMYVLVAFPLYVIAQKTNQENPWFAFVPILNLILMLKIAGKDLWWVILFFVPCVGFIVYAVVWMSIAEAVQKPSWMGLLCVVPGINVIMPFVIAFA